MTAALNTFRRHYIRQQTVVEKRAPALFIFWSKNKLMFRFLTPTITAHIPENVKAYEQQLRTIRYSACKHHDIKTYGGVEV